MVRAGLAAGCVALGIAAVMIMSACGGDRGPVGAPTQAPCEQLTPTYPIKPGRTNGPRGLVYDQTLAPIGPVDPVSVVLCRYRDGSLDRSVAISAADVARLSDLLNNLAADRPKRCAEPTPGLPEDVVILTAADRAVTRVFVEHGGCRGVHLDGQLRSPSKELLALLDRLSASSAPAEAGPSAAG